MVKNMAHGWVCNWRKIKDWGWYKTSNMAHLFQHLFREANHEPKIWQGITLERGQLVVGRKQLSLETGISEQSLRTCIARLKSTNEIAVKSTNKYSIITICNYASYQDKDIAINQQINQPFNQQSTSNQPTTNHKQQLNNDNNETKREKRAAPFNPPSISDVSLYLTEYCKEKNLPLLDPQEFIDFYQGKGWVVGKVRMKDWQAAARRAARNWERKPESREQRFGRIFKEIDNDKRTSQEVH